MRDDTAPHPAAAHTAAHLSAAAAAAGSPMKDAAKWAMAWCAAWNQRDLDSLLAHYDDDVAFASPRIAARHSAGASVGSASGQLRGKAALRAYFQEALEQLGDSLHLELQDVLTGMPGQICVLYTRETGAKAAEVFALDPHTHKATSVTVFYDLVC